MYQTKYIHYKSIFKQGDQNETIEYKSKGIVSYQNGAHIHFETEHGPIHIQYDDHEVVLKNGESRLMFHDQKDVWNDYKLPYGSLSLKTKLLSFEASEERIKMKYELYDAQGCISTVYILIRLVPLGNQEGL